MKYLLAIIFFLIFLILPRNILAATYYVSTTGSDTYTSTQAQNINTPWKTPQKAAGIMVAGDTVLIRGGTYNMGQSRVEPRNSGTSTAYITYKAYPGEHPELISDMSQAIFIAGTSTSKKGYIEINGLTLTAKSLIYAPTESCGTGMYTEYGHHIRILNNIIKGSGGSGITFETGSDYALVEGNIVYDNCWGCSRWRGSGINFHRIMWYDQAPGYHNIARKNIIYHNYHDPVYVLNHSDGNGFIVDESNYVNASGDNPPVLIENNIAFDNAGPCVNIFNSSNVTIRNNTCYQNVNDTYEATAGELNVDGSSNIQAYNNILNPRTGVKASRKGTTSSNISFDYNLNFGGTAYITGIHDINGKDPLFVNPSLNILTADFRLKTDSPAIDSALSTQSPADDYIGNSRPQGAGYDIGAYEYVNSASPTLIPTPTPTPKPGDANSDSKVDGIDYVIWLVNFGKTTGGGNTIGDFNNDGTVNINDLTVWLGNYII